MDPGGFLVAELNQGGAEGVLGTQQQNPETSVASHRTLLDPDIQATGVSKGWRQVQEEMHSYIQKILMEGNTVRCCCTWPLESDCHFGLRHCH